jgi:long-chain acyl-CoA synthetase
VLLQLDSLVHRHARYRPAAPAVTFEDTTLDWRSFEARVNRTANALAALGIGKGDKVATVAGNCMELLETYWAVPMLGAALVPLSPLLLPSGLASLLRDSHAKCLVTQRSMLPVIREIGGGLSPELRARMLVVDSITARSARRPRRRRRRPPASARTISTTSCTRAARRACRRASCIRTSPARCTA